MRNTDNTRRADSGRSRRVRRVGASGVEMEPMVGSSEAKRSGVGSEGGLDSGEDAGAGLGKRIVERGAGRQLVAAAAELLGDFRHVDAPRAEADLHAAARLLHEDQTDLDAGHAARIV